MWAELELAWAFEGVTWALGAWQALAQELQQVSGQEQGSLGTHLGAGRKGSPGSRALTVKQAQRGLPQGLRVWGPA